MIVVGTRKISNSAAPIFWFLPNTRSIDPTIMHAIAPNNKKTEIGSGIPRPEIAPTTEENFVSFTGKAITKTAIKQILPIKSRHFRNN